MNLVILYKWKPNYTAGVRWIIEDALKRKLEDLGLCARANHFGKENETQAMVISGDTDLSVYDVVSRFWFDFSDNMLASVAVNQTKFPSNGVTYSKGLYQDLVSEYMAMVARAQA